jgi:hypothetical protein
MEDIIVRNSKYPHLGNRFEILLTPTVFNTAIVMAPTIELNNQSVGTALEVHDIRTDGMLTAEFYAVQSAVTKHSPEDAFRKRRVTSQLPRPGLHMLGCRFGVFGIAHRRIRPIGLGLGV